MVSTNSWSGIQALSLLSEGLTESVDDAVQRVLESRVEKIYGTWDAYEAAKEAAGIASDHAANFERYGVILQPKQLEFVVAFRSCDEPDGPTEVLVGGARGPGKSYTLMAQIALDDCQRFPGSKWLYLRKTGKQANEQLQDLALSVLQYFPDARVKQNRIDFPNGSRIVIGGFKDDSEAATYQGIEYDGIAIEELTQLSERTYKTLRLSVRSTKEHNGKAWRARSYNSTNPLGVGHQWVKKRFVDNERKRLNKDPRSKFIPALVKDNVFIPPEYIENLKDLTGAERRAYLEGDWDVSAGAYFDEWNETRHVIPDLVDLDPSWSVFISKDYGYSHWDVTYLHVQTGDGDVITFDELCMRKQYPEEIAAATRAMLQRWGLHIENHMVIVGTDVFRKTGLAEETIAEQYAQQGIYMEPADTSPGSRITGAHLMARLLGNHDRGIKPKWRITERCERLRDTMPYLERDPNNPEDVLKVNADENGKGGDDAYDAARYGLAHIIDYVDLLQSMTYAQSTISQSAY